MPGRLFWLASYPKSGNTWFRAFLANLKADAEAPVPINDLSTGQIASSRGWLDGALGFDTADLYPEEIARLRPDVYDWSSEDAGEYGYHKIHDACWEAAPGRLLIGEEATAGALYIIRNPLDVAISYANHDDSDIDAAIGWLNDPDHRMSRDRSRRLSDQVEQRLLSWSGHVESWVDAPGIAPLVIRYEDMKTAPVRTFTRAARFLKLPDDVTRIERAIRFSSFDSLSAQESEGRFREKPQKAARFFRKGVAGDWRETLTRAQVERIVAAHAGVMRRFGYLDAAGRPKVM